MQKEEINLKNLDLPEKVKEEFKFYPELLGQLLFSRGIETREEAEKFLRPDYYRDIHDPFLMKDMDKVVDRILRAIRTNEKILIYSDYDADGIPGAVVLYDFFKKINFENFENYIPHRHDEGYGLNIEAVEKFVEQNFNLIITIDCGIKDIKEIELAQKNNIDVIVTDHHIVGEILPPAYAILNPKQNDCNYPDKNLAGAGVVFKLVQALIKKGNFEIREGWEKWLVDMVGLATISDMVSLKGENRVYSYFGLQVLRKSPRHGLVHLLREIKVDQKNLNEDDIAFMITPRINAASRMGEPIRAFELLSARDIETAGSLAKHLDEINKERKTLVSTIVKEANKKLKERNLSDVIVVGSPKWNPGVSGLVASSLVEKHQRTCFVWGRGGDGEIKGSCRSCGIIDVVELMNAVEDGIFVNIKISLDDVNWNTYKIIEQMAPFGVDNQKPTFLIEDVEIFNVKIFGKQNNHLGIDFKNSRGQNISAIKFFADEIENGETAFKRGDKISLIVNLEKSTFRNVNELRLRIVDFVQ